MLLPIIQLMRNKLGSHLSQQPNRRIFWAFTSLFGGGCMIINQEEKGKANLFSATFGWIANINGKTVTEQMLSEIKIVPPNLFFPPFMKNFFLHNNLKYWFEKLKYLCEFVTSYMKAGETNIGAANSSHWTFSSSKIFKSTIALNKS